jgi:quinol monooxygenase YgiN
MVTAWESESAMRTHFRSPAYARYVSAVTQLLTRPSDVTIYRIANTVHPLADLSIEPQRAS